MEDNANLPNSNTPVAKDYFKFGSVSMTNSVYHFSTVGPEVSIVFPEGSPLSIDHPGKEPQRFDPPPQLSDNKSAQFEILYSVEPLAEDQVYVAEITIEFGYSLTPGSQVRMLIDADGETSVFDSANEELLIKDFDDRRFSKEFKATTQLASRACIGVAILGQRKTGLETLGFSVSGIHFKVSIKP